MGNLGGFEIVIIAVVALLIFGPKKLPEMGRSIGKTLTEFKKGMKDAQTEIKKIEEEPAEKKEENKA